MSRTTLLLSEIFPPVHGGSGRWFWEVYCRQPRPAYHVAAGEHPRQAEFDATHDLPITRLPLHMPAWGLCHWRGLRDYFRLFRRLRQLIAEKHIQALHCGRCLPEGFLAYLLHRWTRIPYLVYVHGEDVTTAAASRELSWMVRRVFRRAKCVIANSRSTRRILLDVWQLPEERVALLYPGVDTTRFVPAPRDAAFRRELGWDERPVILTVGRLQRRKGQDQLIRALAEVKKRIPDVLYAVIGDGDERQRLEELIAANGVRDHVQMLGEIEDARLIRCYQQCDLFALPNRREGVDIEGFGMVLVEAQACGKAVLAGDSGGTAETMRVPQTGRIVNCDGPEALAGVVSELLSKPQLLAQMGVDGRRWVMEQFDWSTLALQAAQLFEQV